jgi:hypothetical protein
MFNGLVRHRGILGLVFSAVSLAAAAVAVLSPTSAQAQDLESGNGHTAFTNLDRVGAPSGDSAHNPEGTDQEEVEIEAEPEPAPTDTFSRIRQTLTDLALDDKIDDSLMPFVIGAGRFREKMQSGEKLTPKEARHFAVALREIADGFAFACQGLPENLGFAKALYEAASALNPHYNGYQKSADWMAMKIAYRESRPNVSVTFTFKP